MIEKVLHNQAKTMKRNLIFLFLLAVLCSLPVLAQKNVKKENSLESLQTEFILLNNLEVKIDKERASGLSQGLDHLFQIINTLLSKRGSVEINVREKTLVITDTEERVKLITEFVKILENSGLEIDELMPETSNNEKKITEVVKADKIFPLVLCALAKEEEWMVFQGLLLARILPKIGVELNKPFRENSEIIGTERKIELAKKIIALFNQPFLLRDYDI